MLQHTDRSSRQLAADRVFARPVRFFIRYAQDSGAEGFIAAVGGVGIVSHRLRKLNVLTANWMGLEGDVDVPRKFRRFLGDPISYPINKADVRKLLRVLSKESLLAAPLWTYK